MKRGRYVKKHETRKQSFELLYYILAIDVVQSAVCTGMHALVLIPFSSRSYFSSERRAAVALRESVSIRSSTSACSRLRKELSSFSSLFARDLLWAVTSPSSLASQHHQNHHNADKAVASATDRSSEHVATCGQSIVCVHGVSTL